MSNWFQKLFGEGEKVKEVNKEAVSEMRQETAPTNESLNPEVRTEIMAVESDRPMHENPVQAPVEHSSAPEKPVEENVNEEKTE